MFNFRNIEGFTTNGTHVNNASRWFDGISPNGTSGYMMEDSYDERTHIYKNDKFIKDGYYGEWVKIEVPTPIYLSHIKIHKDPDNIGGAPINYKIYGKNGMDPEWDVLMHETSAQYNDRIHESSHINPRNSYNKYAICVKRIQTGTMLGIDEFQLFGNEERVAFNATDFYQRVLESDDLQNPGFIRESERVYELLDDITSNQSNYLHKIQFNLPGSNRIPPPETVDLKAMYGSNLYAATMAEQSMYMEMQKHLYNNHISLEDPINDAYLPYTLNNFNGFVKSPEENNYEYIVISLYKEILDRNPSSTELLKAKNQMKIGDIDENMLRVNLLNSSEYRRNVKLQSNDVSADMEYSIAREDMISYIQRIYFRELSREAPEMMILPLKDIFIYLQNNELNLLYREQVF